MVYRFLIVLSIIFISACSSLPREQAVPELLDSAAVISGLNDIRYIVGNQDHMDRLTADVIDTWAREKAWLRSQGNSIDSLPPSHILALSGGGDHGAFGAGFLNGWTATGTRPEFLLVTGISTGALIAPFAFLGSEYDDILKTVYTKTTKADIITSRGVLVALRNDGLADTAPLRNLLRSYIDQAFLDKVADEYLKGRELWISTTNIDSRKRVIWNMTKLAASKHPRALELFQDVMIASASIPVAFSPVMFNVEIDGKVHSEMHVDGGAMSQVFVYPPSIELEEVSEAEGGVRERVLYVIMNARIDPEWAETERNVLSIAERTISSMIHTQGIGDLFRIYMTAQRDKVDFNLAYIPPEFKHVRPDDFDMDYMQALFKTAYDLSRQGYAWRKEPPGFHDEFGY
jgi:predicted acylesterase/phospholipase RssA